MSSAIHQKEKAQTKVCPWWVAYFFDNPLRKMVHKPEAIFKGMLAPGMKVLDIGCGFGHFSLGMARMVGPYGSVTAIDLQPQMLKKTISRAKRAGLDGIITPHQCQQNALSLTSCYDFALASNVLHEVPDRVSFLKEIYDALRHQSTLYLMEPTGHVSRAEFDLEMDEARQVGFELTDQPQITRERCALLLRR
jgi:ubiquinone/menaquinone biosynthesis C-methylase UbiE